MTYQPPTVAVVIPVFQGATTLTTLVQEIADAGDHINQAGASLTEVILVHDGARDDSAEVIQKLEAEHEMVRAVWLSRNYGQHPATLAGIASTTADWIVTIDEDGLHDPKDIRALLSIASSEGADLVYGVSRDDVPHPAWRNHASRFAKRLARLLLGGEVPAFFSSFRLLDGQVGRALAAYCGHGVFLDVALAWVVDDPRYAVVHYRPEYREGASGYTTRKLLSHYRRLVMTAGTRPLRIISTLGLVATFGGLTTAVVVLFLRLFGDIQTQGWASVVILLSVFSGLVLLALGVIAEYLGVALGMAIGRPTYLIVNRPPRRGSPPSS